MDRRSVLRLAGASAATTALAGSTLATAGPAGAASPAFLHGVASGEPLPTSVLLWTRVTPVPEARPGSGLGPDVSVGWQVARDSSFATIVASGITVTGAARDHTVKVDVTGLTPSTTYWYRFEYGGGWSTTGRTKTAPATTAALSRLRMGVVSCASWEAGYFAAYRHLAARTDLDLIMHLGDYIYEYGTGQFGSGGTVIRPVQPVNETLTLADYRIRHGHYKSDPDLQALHAALPWAITWDDHEVANDMWSGGAENHTPLTEGSWTARVAAARQAYFEWMPVRMGESGRIFRRLRFGTLAELSMLDLRTYRSQQSGEINDPTRTITGDPQMIWLKEGLVNATTTWKLVGNPVMIAHLDTTYLEGWLLDVLGQLLGLPTSNGVINNDQWDGYNADRNELVDYLRAHNTRNVVFLTGDIHMSWANELTTPATGTADPAGAEFVVPSVTSDNVNEIMGTSPGGFWSWTAVNLIKAMNPHVRWLEVDGHGYGVFEVTPTKCRMDWFHLYDKTQAGTGTRWAAGWSVGLGSAKLTREYGPIT